MPLRRLFNQALAATLDGHDTSLGIDRSGWLADADEHFAARNGAAVPFLEREAIAVLKRSYQDEFIRRSRDPRVEKEKNLSRIARAAARSTRIEQIEIEPGQYIAKRVVDCTRRELVLLARQYERRARGMWRRATFYRTINHQLELFGMEEYETLQNWLDQQEAV